MLSVQVHGLEGRRLYNHSGRRSTRETMLCRRRRQDLVFEHEPLDSIVGVHLANSPYTYLDRLLNDDCTTVSRAPMTVAER